MGAHVWGKVKIKELSGGDKNPHFFKNQHGENQDKNKEEGQRQTSVAIEL